MAVDPDTAPLPTEPAPRTEGVEFLRELQGRFEDASSDNARRPLEALVHHSLTRWLHDKDGANPYMQVARAAYQAGLVDAQRVAIYERDQAERRCEREGAAVGRWIAKGIGEFITKVTP